MLEMINEERGSAGLNPVVLGSNGAAHIHADHLQENCIAGHWAMDGTTANMRYALAGGQQINGENVSGLNYCIQPWENYTRIVNPAKPLQQAMDGLMNSPGHRATILTPEYRKVNLGISWDDYNMTIVQQFEGDYVRFNRVPQMQGSLLIVEGSTVNGATPLNEEGKLGVEIYYHPLSTLVASQIAQTYCLDPGEYAATLIAPPPPGFQYDPFQAVIQGFKRCVSPYGFEWSIPPMSYEWAIEQFEQVKANAEWVSWAAINWLMADEWQVDDTSFKVSANIEEVLEDKGAGVYRVLIWGSIDGKTAIIGEYPIFYQVERPTGYQ